MTPAPGTMVTPSVRLTEPLRSGGMASVWVADHLTLHTRVVVKFISEQLAGNEEALTRFSREASAAAAVKSPHVVQVLDHGVIDGSPFIVMELLEGEDLRTRLTRDHQLPLAEVEPIVTQACKALGQAHRAGIVHRDIKPDNMFLCRQEDGESFVKLLDFGIAKKDDPGAMSATRTGSVMGTPYYMSPEQVVGLKNIDLRTDLWSLGVVVFEAVTGTKAFNGETLGALAVAITHGPMPVPSRCNPSLPPAFDAWFARACARDAAERFPSAKEMSTAFRLVMGNTVPMGSGSSGGLPRLSVTTPLLGVAAQRPPAAAMSTTTSPTIAQSQAVPPMSSPHPVVIAAVVGAGLLVLGIGGTALYLVKHSSPASTDLQTETSLAPPPPPPAAVSETTLAPLELSTQPAPHPTASSAPKPIPAHSAATKPSAGPSAKATAKPDCEPPYYYDSAGNRVFKKECVQ